MTRADVAKPLTIGSLRAWAVSRLRERGGQESSIEVDWLLTDVLGCGRAHLIANPGRRVSEGSSDRFRRMVERRMAGEPVQYILGWTEFYGLKFEVSPSVLIPRPETEFVVAAVLHEFRGLKNRRILDVGTGSGCIAIAIAHVQPNAEVFAIDVSEAALEIARRNAEHHRAAVEFRLGDMRAVRCGLDTPDVVDIIVSNPPYIAASEEGSLPPEVADFEPRQALFTGDDSLVFYHALVDRCHELLADGGDLIVEIHEDRARQVQELLLGAPFGHVAVQKDLTGRERVVVGSEWTGR